MLKIVLSCLLLALHLSAVASKSLTPILTDTEALDISSVQPVLINDRIIFAGSDSIWSLNTDDLSQETLLNNALYDSNLIRPQFFRLDDQHIYFLEKRNSLATLWRTDGTANGTELALDVRFKSEVNTLNGYIYGKDDQGNIVVSDGHNMVRHSVQPDSLRSLCIFGLNNIIYTLYGGFGHSKDGVDVNLNIPMYGGINYQNEVLAQHNNACYVPATQVDGGFTNAIRNFWKIDPNGNKTLLNHVLPTDYYLRHVIAFKGRLFGSGTYVGNGLFDMIRFDQNVTQVDQRVEMAYPEEYGHLSTIGDYLVLQKSASVDGFGGIALRFFDQNLTLVTQQLSLVPFYNDLPKDGLPPAHQSSTERMVKVDNYVNSFTRESILLFAPLTNPNNQATLPENHYNQVISDQKSGNFYVLSTPDDGAAKTLYRVVESPGISNLISGSWYDPKLRNQGLVIRKGTRQDGREYVMLTSFTFRDGEPFWMAGMAELQPPQDTIHMTLYEYSGIGLFEADSTPSQESFGELELNMTSCNQIQATIETVDETIELALYRLDDVTFTQNCVD